MFIVLTLIDVPLNHPEQVQALRLGLALGMYAGAGGDTMKLISLGQDKSKLPMAIKIKFVAAQYKSLEIPDLDCLEDALPLWKRLNAQKHKSKDDIVLHKRTEQLILSCFQLVMGSIVQRHLTSCYPQLEKFIEQHDLYPYYIDPDNPESPKSLRYTPFSFYLNERLLERGMTDEKGNLYPPETVMEFGITHQDDEEVYGVGSTFEEFLALTNVEVGDMSRDTDQKATVYGGKLFRCPVLFNFSHSDLELVRNEMEPITLPLRKSLYRFAQDTYRKPLAEIDPATINRWFTQEIMPELATVEAALHRSPMVQNIETYFQHEVYFETKLFMVPYTVLWAYYKHVNLVSENSIAIATAALPIENWIHSSCLVVQVKGINVPTGKESTYLTEKLNLEI